ASLYWLAFSLRKQNKLQQADDAIGKLIFKFPKSPWIKDAKSMRIEMSFNLGKFEFNPHDAPAGDDEARVVTLKNVFSTDPQQGISTASDILKPGSPASRTLKEAAIMLVGSSGRKEAAPMLMGLARSDAEPRLRKAAITALRWSKDESVFQFLKDLVLNSET